MKTKPKKKAKVRRKVGPPFTVCFEKQPHEIRELTACSMATECLCCMRDLRRDEVAFFRRGRTWCNAVCQGYNPGPPMGRTREFVARWQSVCGGCDADIYVGDSVLWKSNTLCKECGVAALTGAGVTRKQIEAWPFKSPVRFKPTAEDYCDNPTGFDNYGSIGEP